jgi:hypothetical protein
VTNVDDDATIWLDGDDVRVYREWSIPVTREQRQQLIDQLETPTPCPMIARLDAWGKARQLRRPRAEGHYWVKDMGDWIVAAWVGGVWLVAGSSSDFTDAEFSAIDERRLPPPA